MITTSDTYVLEDGAQVQYKGASIVVEPTYVAASETLYITLRLYDSVTSAALGTFNISITKTDVDGETGTGTGDLATWFNAVEQAVITYLMAFSDNSGVTFSIV